MKMYEKQLLDRTVAGTKERLQRCYSRPIRIESTSVSKFEIWRREGRCKLRVKVYKLLVVLVKVFFMPDRYELSKSV